MSQNCYSDGTVKVQNLHGYFSMLVKTSWEKRTFCKWEMGHFLKISLLTFKKIKKYIYPASPSYLMLSQEWPILNKMFQDGNNI